MFRLSLFILAASLGLTLLVAPRAAPPLGNGAGSEVSFDSVPDRTERDPATEPMSPSWVGATEIQRDASGQFYVDGKVNEAATRFLVDTGADMVALTIDDARRAGLWIDPTSFSVVGAGASGAVRGKQYRVDRLTVAGRTLNGVDVVVLEGLGTNLLGQSVLRRFDKVELDGDRMTLR
ncbi:MAG: TIGR02281 family clan AA aspartic protease [Sphingomicrobium sp.]